MGLMRAKGLKDLNRELTDRQTDGERQGEVSKGGGGGMSAPRKAWGPRDPR